MADITTGLTTAALWESAGRLFGDRTFLVHLDADGRRCGFSYGEFAVLIHQAAHALRDVGIRPGDRVLLQLGNRPELLTALFGLAEGGAIAVPLPRDATPDELQRAYQASGARWAVVEDDRLGDHLRSQGTEAVAGLGVLVICAEEPDGPMPRTGSSLAHAEVLPNVHCYRTLCANRPGEPVPDPGLTGDTVAELLYTSGTTAAPKGVMVTHANLALSGQYGVWQTSLRPGDRVFTTMPACHSNFQLAALTPVLVAGATLVMAERYSASGFWRQVRAERATVVQLIAMMARTLLLQPPAPEDGVHELREALYFMPLSAAEKAEFERRFRLRLLNSYGSTESIGWAVTDPPVGERRWPSIGRAGLGYEVGIFGPDGREVAPGTIGEFRIRGVRGRSLMAGYWNDPDATAAALGPDGWLRTHDEGYQSADGWFYFVDRSVNVIKRAGENVSASEVECVLTGHPLIAEAAVIGVPDPVRDKAVKAFVRLLAGAELPASEVVAHCRRHLASHKVPEFVEFVTDFPRTASLKIEKRRLH